MKIKIHYFASLRDQSGRSHEVIESEAQTPRELFEELHDRYAFTLSPSHVRFAVGDAYVEPDHQLQDGDELVLIPPVAGG